MDSQHSKPSIFRKPNIDLQIFNQSNNFEDACSSDDLIGFLQPQIKTIPKVASWHSFLPENNNQNSSSASVTPNATPQGSPYNNRRLFGSVKVDNATVDNRSNKRWFNSHLFAPLAENDATQTKKERNFNKSNSSRNVSNFDINAIGPISF